MGETQNDKKLDELTRAVNRRTTAMQKLKKGEKPGTISARRLRKLLKQAQRRKKKLIVDKARHEKPKAEATPAAPATPAAG